MVDYLKKYRLARAPTARNDGSGRVDHDIWAIAAAEGTQDWFIIPGRHKTVSVPADELSAALSSGTVGQKVQAYKDALVANLNTQPEPIVGWSPDQLELLLDNNDLATVAAQLAQDFILVVSPSGYPVDFNG